jgi:hypothetical protein
LRDLITLLIQWSDAYTPQVEEESQICNKVVNTLIKLSADPSKIIFNVNIELLAKLMLKWRHLITIDKYQLCNMLNVPLHMENAHLWKMNAIQIIALACSFDIPVLSADEMKEKRLDTPHAFSIKLVENKTN